MPDLIRTFIRMAEANQFYILNAQIRKDGRITEDWSRFTAKPRFEVYSVAKSFVGIGVGIALDEGLIAMDERIGDSFESEALMADNENALQITVRNLLTMTAGLDKSMMWRDGYERKHERNWVRYFYTHGEFSHHPGSAFLYNNACSYMLGAFIQKKTGQNLREYLRHRLFEPIGIHNVEWGSCPMGRTIAANGLSVNVDELGQFGQLLANGGSYNGKRIVSEEYVKTMMTGHAFTDEYIPCIPPKRAEYGYQIWIDSINDAAYMWGIFGQYCIIMPEKNAVITVLALDPRDGGSNGQYAVSPVRKLIWEELVARI